VLNIDTSSILLGKSNPALSSKTSCMGDVLTFLTKFSDTAIATWLCSLTTIAASGHSHFERLLDSQTTFA
jgi:hypothetical protein